MYSLSNVTAALLKMELSVLYLISFLLFQYNEVVEVDEETKQQITTKCVLETTDDDEKLPLVEVNERLIRKLKPHQVEGRFISLCT